MNKLKIKSGAIYITLTAMLAAILVLGKLSLAVIPNVEIVTLCILIFATVFPLKMSFTAVIVFCLVDTQIYGFRPDVFLQYMIHYPTFCVVSAICLKAAKKSWVVYLCALALTVLSCVAFWLETPLIYTIMFGYRFDIYAKLGIPFFLANIISNVIVIGLIFLPLKTFFEKQTKKLFSVKRTKMKSEENDVIEVVSTELLTPDIYENITDEKEKNDDTHNSK